MRLAAGLAAVLTALWGLLMMLTFACPERGFHRGIQSPVLAIELVNGQADLVGVLVKCPAEKLRQNVTLDLIFVPLYTSYMALLALLFGTRLGVILPLTTAAGIADYVENYFIFDSLSGASPHQLLPSLIKWGLLAMALAVIGISMARSDVPVYTPVFRTVLGAAHVTVALMWAVALFGQWTPLGYATIDPGALIFAGTIVFNAFGLLWIVRK